MTGGGARHPRGRRGPGQRNRARVEYPARRSIFHGRRRTGTAEVLVTDRGRPGARAPLGSRPLPPPSSDHGRGLIIMSALADQLEVAAGAGTVGLPFARPAPLAAPLRGADAVTGEPAAMACPLSAQDIDVRLTRRRRVGDDAALTTSSGRHDARLRRPFTSSSAPAATPTTPSRRRRSGPPAIRRVRARRPLGYFVMCRRRGAPARAGGDRSRRRPWSRSPLPSRTTYEQARGRELGGALYGMRPPPASARAVRDAARTRPAEAAAALGLTPWPSASPPPRPAAP